MTNPTYGIQDGGSFVVIWKWPDKQPVERKAAADFDIDDYGSRSAMLAAAHNELWGMEGLQ